MKRLILFGALLVVAGAAYLVGGRFGTTQPPRPRLSGAAHALNLFNAQRAYPDKVMPQRGYTEAYAYAKANLNEPSDQKDGVGPWQAMGPHNIGGRTLAVALNPQNPTTVYAGSASGGLWRSYTGGVGAAAWQYVPTGHPVLGVSCIAIDPADSNTMYIGTGEVYSYSDTQGGISVRYTRGSHGIGILKTTDGGLNWTKSLDWSYNQQRGIWAVKINPQNPSTVFAGTTEGTYKSTNAGQTWSRVHDVIMVTDLVIDPGDTNRVFVACGNFGSPGLGLYRTTDGGQEWRKMVQSGVIPSTWAGKAQLAVSPADPGTVLASISNGDVGSFWTRLVRTNNAGESWLLVSSVDYARWQGWFSHDVAVSPSDADLVITVGIDIWKSTTGGPGLSRKSDWRLWYFGQTIPGEPEGTPEYSHADHHDVVFHPTDPDIIYFANDGGIFRSLDGGETFEGCNGGYQTQQFYAGFSSHQLEPDLAMGGLQDNSTAIYLGSNAWYRAIGGDGSWSAMHPTDFNIMYGSAQYLQMFQSLDGGQEWSDITPASQLVGQPGFIAPFALGHAEEGSRVMFAAGTKIAKSSNGGVTWIPVNNNLSLDNNPAIAMEISATDTNVLYLTTAPVSSRAGVFRSDDGGGHWENITGDLPDRYPVGLAIDPSDDRTVYVTFAGFGTSHVFKSTDGGANWEDIGVGLPDVPTLSVIVDPLNSNYIYVGNDLGVYFSLDGGENWFEYSTGLPGAVVAMDLTISPTDRMLRLSTYGNGVYERELLPMPVGVSEEAPAHAALRLEQNQPNPFNPLTVIAYSLTRPQPVTLRIFDAAGRLVRTLVRERQPVGEYQVSWDSTDESGQRVSSGVYVYELKAGPHRQTRKMTLLK